MAYEIIKKDKTPFLYTNMVSAIKILAKGDYKEDDLFIYNDGKQDIACIISNNKIRLMYDDSKDTSILLDTMKPNDDEDIDLNNVGDASKIKTY